MNAGQQDPAVMGPYQLFQPLGEGGMGKVYLGVSPGFRLVAVKVIRPQHADDPGFRDRFRREVEAAQEVKSMFTPAVLDADPYGMPPWLATMYVPAPSLSEVVRDSGIMDARAVRALGAWLAEALAVVHKAGIVHSDLKPGNVLVAADGARVIDFGIARAFGGGGSAVADVVIGTPGYMAPEQLEVGSKVGPPADVFALGCVLTFAATGASPFGSGEYEEILRRTRQDYPQLDAVPGEIRDLIRSCLHPLPDRRRKIHELLADLAPADPAHILIPQLSQLIASRAQLAAKVLDEARHAAMLPPAGRGDRRRFLIGAAGTGLVLGAGIASGVRILSPRSATQSGSGASAPDSAAAEAAKAGPAPTPLWRRAIRQTVDTTTLSASLVQFGGTLVRWNETSVLGYDASNGAPMWTYPADVSVGSFNIWLGVYGTTLLGLSATADPRLLALNAAGKITSSVSLAPALRAAGVVDPARTAYAYLGAVGGVIVLVVVKMTSVSQAMSATGASVVAVDSASGDALWHRSVSWGSWQLDSGTHGSPTKGGVVDARHCYLQDGSATSAIDLRTGAVRWTAQNTASASAGVPPEMWSDGSTLLVTSSSASLLALDAASGAQLWSTSASTLNALGGLAVGNGWVYQMDLQHGFQALEVRSGKTLWNTPNPLPGANSGMPASNLTLSVSSSTIAASLWGTTSGVVVLAASDGRPLWAYRDPVAAGSTWSVLVSSGAVFGDSGAALYAFPAGAR